jgi:hypothetical protein
MPDREYNMKWETLPAGKFRHRDHRFEWTRDEFQGWANRVAARFGYNVRFLSVGPEDLAVGSPTQMGAFGTKANSKSWQRNSNGLKGRKKTLAGRRSRAYRQCALIRNGCFALFPSKFWPSGVSRHQP